MYKATAKAPTRKQMPYISPDADSHKGGAWKVADTVDALNSKATRTGTYNENLTKFIDK